MFLSGLAARKRIALVSSGFLLSIYLGAAHADHVDPTPIPADVIQKLVTERLAAPVSPLPNTLLKRLTEARALIDEVQQSEAKSYADDSARTDALTAKQMLLRAKVTELEMVRNEVRTRMTPTRAVLASHGLNDKVKEWDNLTAKIESRFTRIESALNAVRDAKTTNDRTRALSSAKTALAELMQGVDTQPLNAPVHQTPTVRSDLPQPKTKLITTNVLPQYLRNTSVPVTTLNTQELSFATASAPALPAGASSCGTSTELNAALAATQDVQITTEISNLAASLNYSPAKIFQYVYQNIQFEPYYGSLKGSVGALVSKNGNATDQSSLLIALLRASNIPARFVKGQIDVVDATSDAQGGRIAKWVGAKSYVGAAAIIGQGQNPAVITMNNSSSQPIGLSLTHVWVEACVPYAHYRGTQQDATGYRWIPLDASFKDINYQAGIVTSVDFDYTGYLAHRNNTLANEYYANQILPIIQASGVAPNGTNNTLNDVPYLGVLNNFTMDILPASLPYEVEAFLPWAGTSSPEIADLPDSHRYKFTITVSNGSGTQLLNSTLSMPQTALARTTLSFQGATASDQTALSTWQNDGTLASASPTPLPCTINVVPVLKGWVNNVEGSTLATGSASSPVGICTTSNQLALSVTLAELVNPTLNNVTYYNINAANYHALQAYAYQASDRLLSDRAAKLLASVKATANPNSDLENTEGEFLHLVGLKYMRYSADTAKRIGQLDGNSGGSGNSLGLISTGMKVVYLFDIPFEVARNGFTADMPGMRSRTVDLVTGNINWKDFLLAGYDKSALEYYIWHENVRMDAVSTVRGLQYATESGIQILTLNSANWAAQSATIPLNSTDPNSCFIDSTLSYPQCWIKSIKTNYIDQGYTVTLPRTLIQYGDWKGEVFVGALDNTSNPGVFSQTAFIINGGSAGGYTVRPLGSSGVGGVPQTTYDAATDSGYVTPNPALTYSTNPPSGSGSTTTPLITNTGGLNNGYDPKTMVVDDEANIANGNMIRIEKDFNIPGRGGLPLALQRAYNSRDPKDGPLGFGWTHNFNQFLKFKDDNADNSTNTADTDGLTSTVGWTNATGGEELFQVTGTSSGVAIGAGFTRVPGTFATMTRNSNGTYTVKEKDGTSYIFESIAGTVGQKARLTSITDRNNNTLTLSYSSTCGNNLCSVTDALGRALTFAYDANNHITTVTDWSGRQFKYAYTDGNNNLNSYSNPLAVAGTQSPVTYQYFTSSDGTYLNHALKKVTNARGNATNYEYYSTGKLFRRTDALGFTKTYTYNDFCRESDEVTERGYTRKYFFDKYGNAIKIVAENGSTDSYTYDTGTPANIFNRLSHKEPQGYTTQFAYDSNGNIIQVTHPSGSTKTFANFTSFNQPGKIKDLNGNYTVLKYDSNGNLTHVIHLTQAYCSSHNCATLDPAAYSPAATDMLTWQVNGYDSFGNRTTIKRVRDFAGQVTTNTATSNTGPIITRTFDSNNLYSISIARSGKKNSETTVTTQTATLVYDNLGRLKTGIDADWYATQFTYDAADRRITGTDTTGNQRTYQFDTNNNATGERLDINSNLIDSRSSAFDANDRQMSSTDAGGNVTAYQHDAAGNLTQMTNPDNYSQRFEYDSANQLIKRYNEENAITSRTLDANGRPRSVTDPNGNSTTYVYFDSTGDGRLKTITDAGNHRTDFIYDANGNVTTITVTGSDGTTTRATKIGYDELNRPTRSVGPQYTDATLGNIRPVTKTVYDNLGNRTQVLAGYTTDLTGTNTASDVLTTQTTFAYDDFSRRIKETDPLNQSWTYTFDANNNLVTTLDALNQTTTYTWLYGHQLLSVKDNANNLYSYSRNQLGQVTQIQGHAVRYNYSYDTAHRRIQTIDSRANKTLTYSYSPGGLLNKMQDSDNDITNYQYDAAGRLAGVWTPNYDYASFGYDAGGRLTEKWFVNGVDARYGYNADNTLATLTNKNGSTTVSSHTYTYDALGNRQTQVETVNGSTINYTYAYDPLNRLTQVQNGTSAQQQNYTYDPLGNRLSKTIGSTTSAYVYDAANQLKEIHNGTATGTLLASLTYDANGGLKTRSDTSQTFIYDALNRLTQVTQTSQPTQNYLYDDESRRISKTVGSTTTNFLYSGPNLIAEYASAWGSPAAQYSYGPMIDNVIEKITSTSAQYFHQDGLNSVMAATNNLGTTDLTQRFDGLGNKVSSTGTAPRFGYTGREPDETGLIYYRARYYDSTLARFTQRDPIGLISGINRYAYANGNAINRRDPTGLDATVSRNGNDVDIGWRIVFTGPGATPDAVSQLTTAIINAWSGEKSTPSDNNPQTYDVAASVTSATSQDPTTIQSYADQGYTIVNLSADPMRSNQGEQGNWTTSNSWDATHEVGHIGDLADRYTDPTPGVSKPDLGWEGNVMADPGGTVDGRNIEGILKSAGCSSNCSDVHISPSPSDMVNSPQSADGGYTVGNIFRRN